MGKIDDNGFSLKEEGTLVRSLKIKIFKKKVSGTYETFNDRNLDSEQDVEVNAILNNTPCCPECGSDNVTDDGSDFLQYECDDCGHIWGVEED